MWGKRGWGSAKRTEYDGRWYQSKAEATFAAGLDLRLKAKEIVWWKPQVPIKLMVNGHLICTYKLDFAIYHLDGHLEYVEVKGHETNVWKLKWKLLHALKEEGVELSLVKA